MNFRRRIALAALVTAFVILGLYVALKPPNDPDFKFISRYGGLKISDQRKGRFALLRKLGDVSTFYGFDKPPSQIKGAIKGEFDGKPGWRASEGFFGYKSEDYFVEVWPMENDELPKGVKTVVAVMRHPTWAERQFRILNSYFTSANNPDQL